MDKPSARDGRDVIDIELELALAICAKVEGDYAAALAHYRRALAAAQAVARRPGERLPSPA